MSRGPKNHQCQYLTPTSQLVGAKTGRIVDSRRTLRLRTVGTETIGLKVRLNGADMMVINPKLPFHFFLAFFQRQFQSQSENSGLGLHR